jgi:GH25 family lysozyme M1 (1,4-beta-N-acetylmuramidase)
MKGIDVSKHQYNIDWSCVDTDFAIIRAGYGLKTKDSYFDKNVKGALENGIKIGFYWFLYCLNESEAVQNAIMFDKVIRTYKDKITMKVWCDFEYDTDRYANDKGVFFDKKARTDLVKAFCSKMIELGYDVGVYANPDYLKSKFNDLSKYPLWLAWYNTTEKRAKEYKPYMWQYTSDGTLDGINGRVDMNYCFEYSQKCLPNLTGFIGGSIVKGLQEKGYKSSFSYRKDLWQELGQTDKYKGTAEQNHKLIVLLGGKVQEDLPSLQGYKGFSIVSALKNFGYPSDFEYRKILWKKIGKTDTYKGTAYQNLSLLNTLRSR